MNNAHAVYAPSSAHRWTVCTASAEAIGRLGEQEEGEEAAKGTAAHEEIERVLGVQGGAVDAAHPAAYGVALVLDYVRQLPPGRLWVEQRVSLTSQIWGRCDVAHYDDATQTLTIVDYKNGFVDVQAVENEQLRIYAAASIQTHGLSVRWIRYVVVQPNSIVPGPRVKQWIESAAELGAFVTRIVAIPAGPLEFKAGEQCKYCPLFGRCPASQDLLSDLSAAFSKGAANVAPELIATYWAAKKPIEDWFKSLEKVATKRALSGATIPGMKLAQTTKHRAWADEKAARSAILMQFGSDALDVPTPAQAEKLGLCVLTSEEAAKQPNITAVIADKPEGGPVLAFASDPRAEWKQKRAAEIFASVGR